jgi:hypothetical protein
MMQGLRGGNVHPKWTLRQAKMGFRHEGDLLSVSVHTQTRCHCQHILIVLTSLLDCLRNIRLGLINVSKQKMSGSMTSQDGRSSA